ncbi:MAG: glycosyl transferase [Rickettsiales bacterium]|nr:glycosyl transferase [Rickettsiales bacterium]OUV53410.1 MAG: hypothetical protein CBC87_04280 [Rickettsiales bacterium TMED127]|tara:strand:+ start:29995 stop:30768 length:774 start_codon:yes stop_codon:yes gene_type:complete
MKKISALVVINDEEKQLYDCLQTLKFSDEIVVILDKCTDNSEKIARKFTDKIFKGSWMLEGGRRNFGIKKCSAEWILEIDADERVPKLLQNEIITCVTNSEFDYHLIPVNNFIGKKLVKFGWGAYFGKSAYPGLFRNKMKIWGNERVHPKIELLGTKGHILNNPINHFYCKSVSDMIVKLDSYSTARSEDLFFNKIDDSLTRNIRRLFSRFWKSYIRRNGYKENKIGFMIALMASLYPLISYIKYKNLKRNEKNSYY